MSALRRCDTCNTLKPFCGGTLLKHGAQWRFQCGDCRDKTMESRFDRDSYWLYKRLGREPSEDEEELFCERVMRLWAGGLEDDEAREEAYRRQFS